MGHTGSNHFLCVFGVTGGFNNAVDGGIRPAALLYSDSRRFSRQNTIITAVGCDHTRKQLKAEFRSVYGQLYSKCFDTCTVRLSFCGDSYLGICQ